MNDPHFFEVAYRMTRSLVRKAVAEDDLAELSMLIERLEMAVEEDGGYRSTTQAKLVRECAVRLQAALDVTPSPTAGGLKVDMEPDDPDWAPTAWVDGRSGDLEDALCGKSRFEVNEVEERAASMLSGRHSGNAWTGHQHYLYLRVDRRMAREVERVQLGAMPEAAARRFKDYRKFNRGSLYAKAKGCHKFNSRDFVAVGGGGERRHGYVCHETPCFVWLVYDDGMVFKKSHGNVTVVERVVGERIPEEYRDGTAVVQR